MDDELFRDLPRAMRPHRFAAEALTLREPVRDQIELRPLDLDGLIGPEHPVRVIWDYLQKLDLHELEHAVLPREPTPDRAPASPRLLLALWLYATSQGIGSARALARLCENHSACRWLCGGVDLNDAELANFHGAHTELLGRLLTENLAALSAAGVIDLDRVQQDGVREHAAAGSGPVRHRKKLHDEFDKARRLIEALRHEAYDDPDASNRRIKTARDRARRERQVRVAAALGRLAEIDTAREAGRPSPPPTQEFRKDRCRHLVHSERRGARNL